MNNKQLKILYLAAWYPHRYDPMPGLFIERYANLVAKKHSIAVFHIIPVENLSTDYEITVTNERDILVVRTFYRKNNKANALQKLFKSLVAYNKGLKAVFKQFGKPDLIHVNVLTARLGLIAYCLKIFKGIPYVITEHSSNFLPEKNINKGFLWYSIVRTATKFSSGTSAVSHALKNAMITRGLNHKHFPVIRNIVPDAFFTTNLNFPVFDKKVITNVTCFDDYVKNISGLIRVAAELSKKRNDFILYLVGEGVDYEMIKQMVEKLGIENQVKLTGLVEKEKLVETYVNSAFTVLFSHYETMSVVIAESLACGRPVVASNAGGIPELVTSENGLLVEPGNESDLLEKLTLMLDTYQNYDSANLRKFAYDNFSIQAVENQFFSFYEKAMS